MKNLGIVPAASLIALCATAGLLEARAVLPPQVGADWFALGSGLTTGSGFERVEAFELFDDGSGPALFVGGVLLGSEGTSIVEWDGSSWVPVHGITGDLVLDLEVFDDGGGGGPALYAAGDFHSAGGMTVNKIARWDGSSWSPVGSGLPTANSVADLEVFDDGSGPTLYAASNAGLGNNGSVHRWTGSSWELLGSEMSGSAACLAVFDDGSGAGARLHVGGSFAVIGGGVRNRIARWNGTSWGALGSGMNAAVLALSVFDDGSGPALYAGGAFTTAGGAAASRIARWNGSSWSAVGGGTNQDVYALAVFDDGTGSALYAGGCFTSAGAVPANHIARWQGSGWSPLGDGLDDCVVALAAVGGGCIGPALFANGTITSFPFPGDGYLAGWGFDQPPTLSCPSVVFAVDSPTSAPGEIVTFSVPVCDDRDPAPSVVCTPPSGSFFPRGTTLVTCTVTDSSGNESSCEFPVVVQPRVRRR